MYTTCNIYKHLYTCIYCTVVGWAFRMVHIHHLKHLQYLQTCIYCTVLEWAVRGVHIHHLQHLHTVHVHCTNIYLLVWAVGKVHILYSTCNICNMYKHVSVQWRGFIYIQHLQHLQHAII
jgi:hypothetical protein